MSVGTAAHLFNLAVGGGKWSAALRRWSSCATNQKVAGSIPDGVTGIFH